MYFKVKLGRFSVVEIKLVLHSYHNEKRLSFHIHQNSTNNKKETFFYLEVNVFDLLDTQTYLQQLPLAKEYLHSTNVQLTLCHG